MAKLISSKLSDVFNWRSSVVTPNNIYGWFVVFFLLVLIFRTNAVCNFPAALQNANYTSSNFGVLKFQVSTLDYAEDGVTTWTCHLNSGNIYIIQSDQTVESFGEQTHFYYCFDLTQQTDYSYSYYLRSTLDNSKRRKTFPNTTTATVALVCDDTPDTAEFNVMVNLAAPDLGRTYCATPLLGDYQYTFFDQQGGAEKCGTVPGDGLLNVCTNLTRNTLILDYTGCSEQVGYSTGGVLYCVASVTGTVGSTTVYYQSLFNADASAAIQFTCMAVSYGTDVNGTSRVYVSQTQSFCSAGQNSTTAPDSAGDTLVLSATATCPIAEEEEESEVNIGLIVGLVILGLVLLAIIAGFLFYCLYWKNRDPNAGKPIVENTKPRFEDPDVEDMVLDEFDLEDTTSTVITREDIAIEAGSPNLLPNGKPTRIPNGTSVGSINKDSYVMFNGGMQNGSLRRDSGIAMTEGSSERPMPRIGINASKDAMVIFNGGEKVISGNASRLVPAENPNERIFRTMNTSGDSSGLILSLDTLEENEVGDAFGEFSDRDSPFPSVPRRSTNLMPPIETTDPENDKND